MGLDTSKKINRVTVNGTEMSVVGVPSLQDKLITENGVYTYDEPYDGLRQVEVDVPSEPNPLIATTDDEMNNLLAGTNTGKVVKFTGTSETYETDTYYVIAEV